MSHYTNYMCGTQAFYSYFSSLFAPGQMGLAQTCHMAHALVTHGCAIGQQSVVLPVQWRAKYVSMRYRTRTRPIITWSPSSTPLESLIGSRWPVAGLYMPTTSK